jgi:imidazolonepropionase-like amidohydrolase
MRTVDACRSSKSTLRAQPVRAACAILLGISGTTAACAGDTELRPSSAGQQALLFEGARLIVGDGEVIESSAILVEGNRFARVGRAGEIDLPSGAVRVDLNGKTVMPALIDTHSHLGYYEEATDTEFRDDFSRDRILDHLDRFAYAGHALTYSLGSDAPKFIDARYSDDPKTFVDLREESERDSFSGARYLTVGRGLAWPGTGNPRSTSFYPAVSPWVAQAAIRELAAQDVELVKLWIEDRWGFDDPRSEDPAYMTSGVYGAAIREAQRLGLRTIAHVKTLHDWKEVIRAGVDATTHTVEDVPVDDELLALIRDHPRFTNLSVLTSQNIGGSAPFTHGERPAWLRDPLLTALKCPAFLEEWGESFEGREPPPLDGGLWARNTVRVRDAGATIIMGSHDAGGRRALGWGSHMEMEAFVNWVGMTPAEALASATIGAARFIGVDDRLGSVAEGKSADFVVLDASPLDDITNTRRIADVYLHGRRVDRAGMADRWHAECVAAGAAQ